MQKTKEGIYYSRYIVSWLKELFPFDTFPDENFEEWLRRRGLSEDEITDIQIMAMTGKFELEQDLKPFIQEKHLKEYGWQFIDWPKE